ncbi:NarK/NasA family nitrate transporter [Tessaracoccus rhinocerotis]|uniref:NarK/NasA family nitrate transporter n=1 Tax=Tessaracoccus rhinocerotis TaxID=1689449 RepID=A0A553JWS0_9ACTN|nr:MFS transporter [Tessaracoccus rhinocerotis]TRY16895.1 NarK/NasA family nitrate transporter [Tessaracoccus rhinocerotis]
MSTKQQTQGDWLQDWDPEDEQNWNKKLAWHTLVITTFSLTMCFVAWFLPSAIIPKLRPLGYDFTPAQLYWMAAMPGLSGGALRILWMILPPKIGTRKLVTLTTLLLLLPILGWAFEITNPDVPYWRLMGLAILSGIGGGAFSGLMPSTSYFFPKRLQGTALGLQAGIGNFGVSLVQLLTPWLISFPLFGFAFFDRVGSDFLKNFGYSIFQSNTMTFTGKPDVLVWYQNSALVYLPFIFAIAIWAYIVLKSVPMRVSIKQQFDIFSNVDTHLMTILYIMTFGTFSGLAAQFGLMMENMYGQYNESIVANGELLIPGYNLPDVVNYIFLGPLVGAAARIVFAPLTDRMGGAVWTLISGIGILGAILFTIPSLTPDVSSAEALTSGFNWFLYGMIAIFFFTGIGNASTFKQMPMIFEKRQAGGVIGWTSAVAAFGPFLFGVGLTIMSPTTFYWIGAAWAVMCIIITWVRYAGPNAPKKG